MPIAVQNFLMVVVLPIAVGTGIIYLFRWGLKRSTGYDPMGEKGQIRPTEQNTSTRPESYAPYQPTKWREEKKE